MIERRMTVSQARHLLRALVDRNQAHFLRLGEDILSPNSDAKMALADSQLTYRALEYFRQQSKEEDPRIRLRLFENVRELEDFQGDEEESAGLTEQSLERRAREAATDVASKAKDVAAAAKNVQAIASGFQVRKEDRLRADVKATLQEMERAFRKFKSSTHVAIEEYLGNQNPLVLDLIKDYDLDIAGARHGLRVACLATELAAHLRPEAYFGKTVPDEIFQRLDIPESERDYSPDGIDRVRQTLFRRELVEIFLGGFLHDAGLWSSPMYDGHEQRGARIVSELAQLGQNVDAIADIVLLHGELEKLATHSAVIRTRNDGAEADLFTCEFYVGAETAEENYLLRSGGDARLIREEGLRTILPVAIAEFWVTSEEDDARVQPKELVEAAVDKGDTALYAKFMMTLCNSQPKVEAPPRALVGFEGKLPAGARGKKHLMQLDGDVGISVYNAGWQGPHVIRILRKRPDGGLEKLERLRPEHPGLLERSHTRGYMYVPVGRMGNLTVTVIGILGKEAFERNFREYAEWVERIAEK